MEMDEETRRLAEEVGTAINESVQQSAAVAAAIERLREAGFEMELTLKLEIGLRPHAGEDQPANEDAEVYQFTDEDLRVLRSMKIKIDSEG
jgi:hypothetical protein